MNETKDSDADLATMVNALDTVVSTLVGVRLYDFNVGAECVPKPLDASTVGDVLATNELYIHCVRKSPQPS